jgi:hypothetical protein
MLHQHRQSGEWFTVPPEVAIAAVMGAAYRMGHAIRPVDPDRVEAFTPKIREEMPKWAQWAAFCIYLIVFFAVLFKTDHFDRAHRRAPCGLDHRTIDAEGRGDHCARLAQPSMRCEP